MPWMPRPGAGLLTALGGGMYRIHPALPAYLAALWRTQEHAGYETQQAAATRALLTAYAAFGGWLDQQIASGDAGLAYTIIGLQQRTMGHLLGYALDHQHWDEAEAIAQPLNEYWKARDLYAEADAWTDRVRLAVEDPTGAPAAFDSPAGSLWLFLTGAQATRQIHSGQLDKGERTYREVLAMLEAQPDSPFRQNRLAVGYHLIGSAALQQGRLDEAGDWYTRSAALNEELGDQPGLAMCYHQLGMVAQGRGRLDEAEDWYTRAVAIAEDLGDRPGLARSYHQLGMVAQGRGRLDEAEDWYTRSVAIAEDLGDRPELALSFGQFGPLAEERGNLRQALEWMVRCVTLFEDFPHPSTGPGPGHLARLTRQLGVEALEACWMQIAGHPLPDTVRVFASTYRPGGGALGGEAGE